MTVPMVLLPVFVLVVLTFALMAGTFVLRTRTLQSRETRLKDIALGQPNWPARATQVANCYGNQFELPVLFYLLIAFALPLRHADLVIVVLSWVFVLLRYLHAGVFVTSNFVPRRGVIWFAGAVVLVVMWVYFALRILLV